MTTPAVVRLYWDYGAIVYCEDDDELPPLSDEVERAINDWGKHWLQVTWPDGQTDLCAPTHEEWAEWSRRGRDVAQRLQGELGSAYRVVLECGESARDWGAS